MTIKPIPRPFPADFVWGFAAAAPQIEGAAFTDGKGVSVWDTFARIPGKVHNRDTLDVACDHYHRYPEDLALMASLGAKHYRLSIAWPRIFPNGDGSVNQAGIDFYNKLIDKALASGLTPWVTMFHWDLPQSLEDRFGGWRGRETALAFATYAETIVKALGDRVKHWITLNEVICFTTNAYGEGSKAPGLMLPEKIVNQTYHHAMLAHGYGVRAVREFGGAGARVGITDCAQNFIPLTETPENIAAAHAAFVAANARVLEPMYKGRYHPDFLAEVGSDAPEVQTGDMEIISLPTDFLGLNIYRGVFVRAGADGKPEILDFPPSFPRADATWLTHTPQAMYWCTRSAAEVYGVESIYITENGAGYNDEPPVNGDVLDLHRRDYLRNYLRELQRAIDDGVPVHGYFLWSFMDNFEWGDGYARRFGVVYTNYETQERTPKASAKWYSQVIKANQIV
jgi:beta-glucosidase